MCNFQPAVPFLSESHDKAQFSWDFCRCLKDVSKPADITLAVWSVPLWASECLMEMHSGMCGGELGRWQLCQETALVVVKWRPDAGSGRSYS